MRGENNGTEYSLYIFARTYLPIYLYSYSWAGIFLFLNSILKQVQLRNKLDNKRLVVFRITILYTGKFLSVGCCKELLKPYEA